uniref:(California timema) hypothetical protein n=1 Tax=Timema californicum TaxID=61474 RepID=A0A7R9IY90_TIMCA|nr:unnamed protein product [Timema californicum]
MTINGSPPMQVLVIRRPNPRSSLNGQSDPLDSMPMLGQLRRTDDVGEDVEYYRVRSFSITPNGIFNLGDSFRSRRSRSINSASSSGSSQSINSTPSHRERVPSCLSTLSSQCLVRMRPVVRILKQVSTLILY